LATARNIEFDNGSSAKVDMTNLTSDWKEFLLGLPDPGSLTFTIDLNLGDAGHAALRAAARQPDQVRLQGRAVLGYDADGAHAGLRLQVPGYAGSRRPGADAMRGVPDRPRYLQLRLTAQKAF
jgi:hypothetical protein